MSSQQFNNQHETSQQEEAGASSAILENTATSQPHIEDSCDSASSSGKPSKAIKKQMKLVMGSLEGILDELKSVVGDLRDVVGQIDDVTSQIEDTTANKNNAIHSNAAQMPNGNNKTGDRKKERMRRSLDSGFPDNSTTFSEDSTDTRYKSHHCLNYNSHFMHHSAPVSSPTERSRWSDNELLSSSFCQTDRICCRSILSGGFCCAHQKKKQKQRRHSHTNTADMSVIKTAPGLQKQQQQTEKNCQKVAKNIENCMYSRIVKKIKPRAPNNNNNEKSQKIRRASLDKTSGMVKSPAGGLVGKTKASSAGAPSITGSDHCDYYEKQLEQQLENIPVVDGNNGCDRTGTFSTVDMFTLKKGRTSYSDTLYSALLGSEDTAYESDSSREGGTRDDFSHQSVIKSSDTFRYKVKQIGMRKMTKVGSCRVVIEP